MSHPLLTMCCFFYSATCKLNNNCTCEIKVTHLDNQNCIVSVCKTHYGHTLDLGQIWLSKNKREEIAAKLQQGMYHESEDS